MSLIFWNIFLWHMWSTWYILQNLEYILRLCGFRDKKECGTHNYKHNSNSSCNYPSFSLAFPAFSTSFVTCFGVNNLKAWKCKWCFTGFSLVIYQKIWKNIAKRKRKGWRNVAQLLGLSSKLEIFPQNFISQTLPQCNLSSGNLPIWNFTVDLLG